MKLLGARLVLAIAAFFSLVAPEVRAQPMIVPESHSCGAWIKNKSGRSGQEIADYNTAVAWVWGFVSRAAETAPTILRSQDDGLGLRAWVDRYCAANPLDDIVDAARALERELIARTGPATKR